MQNRVKVGGQGRNRTDDEGFAGPCITTLLPSRFTSIKVEGRKI